MISLLFIAFIIGIAIGGLMIHVFARHNTATVRCPMGKEFNQDRFYSLENAHKEPKENLRECFEVATAAIRKSVVRQLGVDKQLQQVVLDLQDMREKSPVSYDTTMLAITMYPSSYAQIAEKRGVSKTAVWRQMRKIAEKYPWAEALIDIMARR